MFTIDNRFSNFNSMVLLGEFHLNSSSKTKTSLSWPRSGDQYNAPSSSYRISVGKQSWTQHIIVSLLTSGRLAVQPTFRLFQTIINNINMWWIFTINVSATGGGCDLKYDGERELSSKWYAAYYEEEVGNPSRILYVTATFSSHRRDITQR